MNLIATCDEPASPYDDVPDLLGESTDDEGPYVEDLHIDLDDEETQEALADFDPETDELDWMPSSQ